MLALWFGLAFAGQPGAGVEVLAAGATLHAQPVHLAQPWRYTWMNEPRTVYDGVLIVVRVDPELARPRQVLNPVLFVGAEPVEVLRQTSDASCLVGLVPRPAITGDLIFWAPAERLPEDIDVAWGRAQLSDAMRRGASAVPAPRASVASVSDLRAFDGMLDAALSRCR